MSNKYAVVVLFLIRILVYLTSLFRFIKKVFVATLGIEILCIMSAEIRQNTGIYIFRFNLLGIVYHILDDPFLAGFSTFTSIVRKV